MYLLEYLHLILKISLRAYQIKNHKTQHIPAEASTPLKQKAFQDRRDTEAEEEVPSGTPQPGSGCVPCVSGYFILKPDFVCIG